MTNARAILLSSAAIVGVAGASLWIAAPPPWRAVGSILAMAGLLGVIAVLLIRPHSDSREESDDPASLTTERCRELMRGTGLYLREMQYRYSVRVDGNATSGRRCFAAEVNSIRLGFVPAVITDNTTDRQGFGYVAFVHDGRRWRGPGLPCPNDQIEAVRHAAKCVSPLSKDDETRIEDMSEMP